MIVPARYSPNRMDVTMEMPPSRSEPKSRFRSFRSRAWRSGAPPRASVASKGIWYVPGVVWRPKRRARCERMAAVANAAMTAGLTVPELHACQAELHER